MDNNFAFGVGVGVLIGIFVGWACCKIRTAESRNTATCSENSESTTTHQRANKRKKASKKKAQRPKQKHFRRQHQASEHLEDEGSVTDASRSDSEDDRISETQVDADHPQNDSSRITTQEVWTELDITHHVKQVLPDLLSEVYVDISKKLLQIGVQSQNDFVYVWEDDLHGILIPLNITKLLHSWSGPKCADEAHRQTLANVERCVERIIPYLFGQSLGELVDKFSADNPCAANEMLAKIVNPIAIRKRLNSRRKVERLIDVNQSKYSDYCYAILVDNSNVFIEGQKYYAKHFNLQVQQDFSFRYAPEKMIHILLKGRQPDFKKIYGSDNVNSKSVSHAFKQRGNEVNTFNTNVKNKEKEVDTALTADAIEFVCKRSYDRETPMCGTVIIVSGDRDYLPMIKKILKLGWHVEIAAFSESISKKVEKMQESCKLLKVKKLEKYFEEEPKWHFCERQRDLQDQSNTFIDFESKSLPFEESFDDKDEYKFQNLAEALTQLLHYPCNYKHQQTNDSKGGVLLLTFSCPKKNSSRDNFRREWTQRFEEIRVLCEKHIGKLAEVHKGIKQEPVLTPIAHRFDNLRKAQDYVPGEKSETDEVKKPTKKCKYAFNCRTKNNLKCKFEHSEEEKQYFRVNADAISKKRLDVHYKKTKCDESLCKRRTSKRKEIEPSCHYYHSKHEARCYQCTDPLAGCKGHTDKTYTYKSSATDELAGVDRDEDYCDEEFECTLGKSCPKNHTEGEKKFFKDNRGVGAYRYKSKRCKYYLKGTCQWGKATIALSCSFYHSEEEAKCYDCVIDGRKKVHSQKYCVRSQ